jgi:hypothetical protein
MLLKRIKLSYFLLSIQPSYARMVQQLGPLAQLGPLRPRGPARLGCPVAARHACARAMHPRLGPQPGPGLGKHCPACAYSRPVGRRALLAANLDRMAFQPSRRNKTSTAGSPLPNPRPFFPFFPFSQLPTERRPPEAYQRRWRRRHWPLAGACARPCMSAPPSSGLVAVPWARARGVVDFLEPAARKPSSYATAVVRLKPGGSGSLLARWWPVAVGAGRSRDPRVRVRVRVFLLLLRFDIEFLSFFFFVSSTLTRSTR